MTDCPGGCNTWHRNLPPDQQADTPAQQGDPWCGRCTARIRRALPDSDYLAAMVAAHADGHREHVYDHGRRGNGHAPSPSPLGDIVSWYTGALFDSEDAYRAILKIGGAVHFGPLPEIRSKVIFWLAERLDGILKSDMGPSFGQEVLDWHRRLEFLAKAGTGIHRMPAPCPWCGNKTLMQREGDDHVTCTWPGPPPCRCRLTMDEYRAEEHTAAAHLEHAG